MVPLALDHKIQPFVNQLSAHAAAPVDTLTPAIARVGQVELQSHAETNLAVEATASEEGPTDMSETTLVSMAKLGDCDAFVQLSKLHSNRLLRTIYNITRNWHDAEDALQDAMLRAFSHLKAFQGKSSFSTWLTRIAINSALMILRKKHGCYEIPFEGIDDSGDNYERLEVKSPAENPESRLARKEREELLRDAILRLPQALREVVELRQARGYSTREIAEALGISVPAVKSRLSRAKLTLRTALLPAILRSESYQPSPPDANDCVGANVLGGQSMSQFRHEHSRLSGLPRKQHASRRGRKSLAAVVEINASCDSLGSGLC
jgi:RNA polymerase sigma-70 factor, ECF subfamily